uniref:DUF5641 domain-containing protein n=1 Tax=Timema bartmani TaxID=61472 RepID=A0A7R9F7T0_9NEOP|nr:unnamed protein product [Timema bartmani]
MRLKEEERMQNDFEGNKLFWKWVKRTKQGVQGKTYDTQNERDGGANFVGACRQLSKLEEYLSSHAFTITLGNELASRHIEWKINPGGASRFGGVWESNVHCTGDHLKRLDYWKSWKAEYLHTLQSRAKWTVESIPMEKNTVVILLQDKIPPFQWLLVIGTELVFPACVVNGTGVSKTFQILYRNEEVLLNDVIMFRVHILVDSHKFQDRFCKMKTECSMEMREQVWRSVTFCQYDKWHRSV